MSFVAPFVSSDSFYIKFCINEFFMYRKIKMLQPTPVVLRINLLKTVRTGREAWISFFLVWDMLLVWVISGGFPTSATKTEEVCKTTHFWFRFFENIMEGLSTYNTVIRYPLFVTILSSIYNQVPLSISINKMS